MRTFLSLGSESAILETKSIMRIARMLLGHVGLGFALKLWALKRALKNVNEPPQKVFDIGCGDGMYDFYLARRWPKIELYGIDGGYHEITRASKIAKRIGQTGLNFKHLNFESYQSTESFDLILCLDSIYYGYDGLSMLRKACQSLNPQGYLVFSMPYLKRHYKTGFDYYTGRVDIDSLDSIYTYNKVIDIIESEGLEIICVDNYPSVWARKLIEFQRSFPKTTLMLYPVMLVLTWLGRKGNNRTASHFMLVARMS